MSQKFRRKALFQLATLLHQILDGIHTLLEPCGTKEIQESVQESMIEALEAVSCNIVLHNNVIPYVCFAASTTATCLSKLKGKLCHYQERCRLQEDSNDDLKHQQR